MKNIFFWYRLKIASRVPVNRIENKTTKYEIVIDEMRCYPQVTSYKFTWANIHVKWYCFSPFQKRFQINFDIFVFGRK